MTHRPVTDRMYEKYEVYRTDGTGIDQCLVLEFEDPRAWPAIGAYTETIRTKQPGFAKDLDETLRGYRRTDALTPNPTPQP